MYLRALSQGNRRCLWQVVLRVTSGVCDIGCDVDCDVLNFTLNITLQRCDVCTGRAVLLLHTPQRCVPGEYEWGSPAVGGSKGSCGGPAGRVTADWGVRRVLLPSVCAGLSTLSFTVGARPWSGGVNRASTQRVERTCGSSRVAVVTGVVPIERAAIRGTRFLTSPKAAA